MTTPPNALTLLIGFPALSSPVLIPMLLPMLASSVEGGGTAMRQPLPPSTLLTLSCSPVGGMTLATGFFPAPDSPALLLFLLGLFACGSFPFKTRLFFDRLMPCEMTCWKPRASWCSSANWGTKGLRCREEVSRKDMERTVRSSMRRWKASPNGPAESPRGFVGLALGLPLPPARLLAAAAPPAPAVAGTPGAVAFLRQGVLRALRGSYPLLIGSTVT
mmetsp:Transcript_1064/g.2313  ORF Transcript_1064/g.2313 Transcript_1064/m.2313 type:complete len:218 (-) Transcript_1064:758-1411(-)